MQAVSSNVHAVLVLALGLAGCAPPARQSQPMELILLIGQSNMAGRGVVATDQAPADAAVKVLNDRDEWVPARDPLHFDKPAVVGVGPGLAFARYWRERNPKATVGLVPCAVGGSGIDDWQPGRRHAQTGLYPYDAMLRRMKVAQESGRLKAILWHQGESDSRPDRSRVYAEKLAAFFDRLRRDLGAPDTPVLLGTLGDFYVSRNPDASTINQRITDYTLKYPNAYLVSAAGLTHKGDTTHFDTPSARELGRRYGEKLWQIQNK